MSKSPIPFAVGDVSVLARALGAQLSQTDSKPGHVELLNMLARSAGFRNFQHFRASQAAHVRLSEEDAPATPIDHLRVEQVMRHFDAQGRLIRWPGKTSHQELSLWVLWSRVAPRQTFTEAQINETLRRSHSFGDHALLRRALVSCALMTRTTDCRDYRRVERTPPGEALALIRRLPRQTV